MNTELWSLLNYASTYFSPSSEEAESIDEAMSRCWNHITSNFDDIY